ncbi:MAG: hypothetical protein H6Q53_2061 [Deltaproteobacteria bacterium]|jgi:hypothetical protein|nr:hypothetical protein [Deltaproteobacteria bacterium]
MIDRAFRISTMLSACIIGLVFLVTSPAYSQQNYTCSPTESSAQRQTVFISDLHMGVGRDPSTKEWNPMEDFRWEKEFGLFLQNIDTEGKGKTDLVIVGDLFELWQFVKDDCDYKNPDLGCTEEDALKRLYVVLERHEPEMKMLKEFADRPHPSDNRVYIVPGNHDAALLYGMVAQDVIKKINAAPGKVCILTNGYWRSSDGLIYADHGHQIEDADPNSYKEKWPKPFIEVGDKKYLIRVWGERFVQKYYSDIEKDYPIIDNLSSESLGIKYGVAAKGFLLPEDIVNLSKFVFFQVSEDQFIASLHGLWLKPEEHAGTAEWDIKNIRSNNDPGFASDLSAVMEKLPLKSGTNKIVLKKAVSEGIKGLKPSDLSDDEITALCNLRAAILEDMKKKKLAVSIQNCPTTKPETLGIQKLIWGEDVVFRNHLQEYLKKTREQLPPIGGVQPMFQIYVYGHTHSAHGGNKYKGMKISGWPWPPQVFNSGTWLRVTNEEELEKKKLGLKLKDNEVLPRIPVEELPARYSFVWIKPYEKKPVAELKYWVLDATGAWSISD